MGTVKKPKAKTNEKTTKAAARAKARANPEPEVLDSDAVSAEVEAEAPVEVEVPVEAPAPVEAVVDAPGADAADASEAEVEAGAAEPNPEWAPAPDVEPLRYGSFAGKRKAEREARAKLSKERMRARTRGYVPKTHQRMLSHQQRVGLKRQQVSGEIPPEAVAAAQALLLKNQEAAPVRISRSNLAKQANASTKRQSVKDKLKARRAAQFLAQAEAMRQYQEKVVAEFEGADPEAVEAAETESTAASAPEIE